MDQIDLAGAIEETEYGCVSLDPYEDTWLLLNAAEKQEYNTLCSASTQDGTILAEDLKRIKNKFTAPGTATVTLFYKTDRDQEPHLTTELERLNI